MTTENPGKPEIDTTVPHSARIWNYWLGGKDNFPVDREAGDKYAETFPGIFDMARASREYIGRAVTFLAAERGVRQFLDIGTGLPTENNTHQVAQRAAPESRIVYVDNDPLVLGHARALLTSRPEGATFYLDADLEEPEKILEQVTELLDFSQPVALMLMGILGHIRDYEKVTAIVGRLLQALPPGSYLAVYDGTATDPDLLKAQEDYDDTGAEPYRLRSPEQLTALFTGLELEEPGVVPITHWHPEPSPLPPLEVNAYGGVARKP
ncbi:SAM-dependent methyltransferase [Actinomadura barringtoniae]|uniref:SAM-dependent methyltransferase n=1 Tax=Actinomadura barringtoniae TaxID=1427535 RepID=A0A939PAD4_9ACTN|nr:SAM-dependent methyltransferase [Actinomadura barringtoniae]MBO2446343.1 SAM-dependent methyltransferase [Actinomadura barringtoniae]